MESMTDEIGFYETHKRIGVFEPISFWRDHALDMPRMTLIANRLMALVPSSASTERMFSQSKRIQGLRRTHMSENVFEDQVLIVSNPALIEVAYDGIKEWTRIGK